MGRGTGKPPRLTHLGGRSRRRSVVTTSWAIVEELVFREHKKEGRGRLKLTRS
jgi:hypothetical protein